MQMSLMNSTEIENIEKWLERAEYQMYPEDSPKKLRFEDEKKFDEHDLNFSLIRAIKETGIDLNLKPRETNPLQDSFYAIQQLISPTQRKNSQPVFERASIDQGEEKAITMQLSKLMEALGYTREIRNKTSAREEDSNIHAEVDRILKDLELTLEKVDDVSSDAESEEAVHRILADLLDDEIFKEDKKPNAFQANTENANNQEPIKVESNIPQINLEIPAKIIVERASPENKINENIMIIDQKPETIKELPRENQPAEIKITEKTVKKVIKLQKRSKKGCSVF